MPLIDLIAGARPNFMKVAPIIGALQKCEVSGGKLRVPIPRPERIRAWGDKEKLAKDHGCCRAGGIAAPRSAAYLCLDPRVQRPEPPDNRRPAWSHPANHDGTV